MKDIKVSVIVPVYNVEEYLAKCLDSLVNQTLEEIEILVVNDGSPDNSQAIIDDYAQRYPTKIRPFVKENGGLSDTRNFAMKHAEGEYIAFVDSDDYVDIDMYELMYNKAKETDSDIVNCAYSSVMGRTIRRNYYGDSMQYFGKSAAESPQILRYANSIACNKIFRKAFWDKHNFQFPVGQWFEDSALIYKVLWCANKVECVNIPFYYYVRTREDSITNTVNERIFDIFKSMESIITFFRQFPQTPELIDEINYLCLRHTLARVYKLEQFECKNLAKRFLNECYDFYNKHLPGWKKNSFVCAPKTAKPKTKRTAFINRHKAIARWYYIGSVLKNLEQWYENTFEAPPKPKTVLTPEERLEITNQKKRKAIQANGIKLIAFYQKMLKEIGIVSFADFGTMLGIVREGRLLAHDLDIDMGVIIKDKSDLDRIRLHLEKKGVNIWRQYFYGDMIVEESYHFCGLKVDLNYYRITDEESKTWLFYREPDVEYFDNERNIVEMTYSPIKEFKTVEIAGEEIVIPANAEQLLLEKYGPTWRTPDKGWIYWLSPAAQKIEEMGYYVDYRFKRTSPVDEEWFAKVKQGKLKSNRKYQLKQLKILKAVSKICKRHKITYYLGNTTLRFAEHYNGCAPWNASFTLLMKKKQYNKFIKYASKELPDKFILQHRTTTKNYWAPYVTVRSTDNSKFYQKCLSNVTEFNGPFINIAPLYAVPKPHSKAQQRQSDWFIYYWNLLKFKSKIKNPKTPKEKRMSFLASIMPYKLIHFCLRAITNMFRGKKCDYLVNLTDKAPVEKITYPKEYFKKPKYIQFEGLKIPVPTCSDEVLKQRYGYNYALLKWDKRKIRRGIACRKKTTPPTE